MYYHTIDTLYDGVSRFKVQTAVSKFTLKLFFQFFFIFFVFQRTFFSNIPFSGHLGLSKKRGQLWVSNSFLLWRYNPWNIVQKSISAYLFSIKGYVPRAEVPMYLGTSIFIHSTPTCRYMIAMMQVRRQVPTECVSLFCWRLCHKVVPTSQSWRELFV